VQLRRLRSGGSKRGNALEVPNKKRSYSIVWLWPSCYRSRITLTRRS
jgi:hypothetical protein